MEIIDENRNINNELSQIIVTNESVFLFEEILFSSDYENDKNWEDYFFLWKKK